MKLRSKAILILVVTLCLLLPLSKLAIAQFSDIEGYWAERQISDWLDKGAVTGYPDGTFAPANSITRAEFITLVNKLLGFHEKAQVTFNDVSKNDWFYEEVSKARAAGYMIGYEDNTLHPGNPIKREEVSTVIFRLLDMEEGQDSSSLYQFEDAVIISSWAKPSVAEVVDYKLMKGYPDRTFKPLDYITRAEALVTLDNLFWFKHPVLITPLDY
ncbi:MAG: S-layer homology domain-containing protein [Desulfotomaculaceae bacterium]|nr:S-layer homology domain-containing protein [Desulfotomaculaceae bacterium]